MFYSRLDKLEESLKDDTLTESQKQEKRQQHAQKETEFLRLKRSRLGVEDFEPLKVCIIFYTSLMLKIKLTFTFMGQAPQHLSLSVFFVKSKQICGPKFLFYLRDDSRV